MERIVVSGAALKDKLARVTLRNVPDRPGMAAKVFHTIASGQIVVDDIIQTQQDGGGGATVSFTVDMADLTDATKMVDSLCKSLKCEARYEDNLAKVSVVGVGMRVHTGVAERMFAALAKAGVNIQNITTSEIKISVLISRDQGKQALRIIHDAFELGGAAKAAKPAAAKAPKSAKKAAKTARTAKK
jgi:aspartate kinase